MVDSTFHRPVPICLALTLYDLACKVPLLVLMLRAGFCFELGWVREPELEFVLTNYADLNVVVI